MLFDSIVIVKEYFLFLVSETVQSFEFPPQNGSVCFPGLHRFALSGNAAVIASLNSCLIHCQVIPQLSHH